MMDDGERHHSKTPPLQDHPNVPNPSPHAATLDDDALLAQCELSRTKGSGPGGQRKNKVATAVVLTHRPTGHVGQASERREAEANKRQALRRLRLELALHERVGWTARSELWEGRRQGTKLRVNPDHRDFPALLSEALDLLTFCGDDPAKAAAAGGISTSQLIKLIALERRALDAVNQRRTARGQHALKA